MYLYKSKHLVTDATVELRETLRAKAKLRAFRAKEKLNFLTQTCGVHGTRSLFFN